MANPINPLNRSTTSLGSQTDKAQVKNTTNNSVAPTSTESKDTVSLSTGSQQVSSLQQALTNSSGIDIAKVENIKQEIANGNYPLDAEKTAANFINLEQELLK